MAKIGDDPLISHVLSRALAISQVKEVVLATTNLEEDDVLVSFVESKFGLKVYRGDSEDVRSRFIEIIRMLQPENVIRLTADDPFKDPKLAEDALRTLIEEDVDYVSNFAHHTLPIGLDVEAFTSRALLDSMKNFESQADLEHVTPALRNSGRYNSRCLFYESTLANFRLTVDTPEDLKKCIVIHELLKQFSVNNFDYKTTCKVIKSAIEMGRV